MPSLTAAHYPIDSKATIVNKHARLSPGVVYRSPTVAPPCRATCRALRLCARWYNDAQVKIMRNILLPLSAALGLWLTGCSENTPAPKKKEAEKVEPVTGQSALFKMYQVARSWAPDAQVLKMNSMPLTEVPNVPPGTAAAWEATFVSAAGGKARRYTYSIVESEGNLHKGVFPGQDEGWSGARGNNTPFTMMAVKVDTPDAYKTALGHGGADYDKKTPGKPIAFLLEKVAKYPDPVWRVIWGESASTSNFSVYVDASTGDFKETMH